MNDQHCSFEELLFNHVEMLYDVAVGLTHDPLEAKTLTEDTVARALQAHNESQLRIQLKPWLLTMLRNTFLARKCQGRDDRRTTLCMAGGYPVG